MTRILFVCLGNICRSPIAEGVMRHLVEEAGLGHRVEVDSAGTGAWHAGERPDPRSVATARSHGVSLDDQRARQLKASDYHDFDWILAMDRSNLETIEGRRAGDGKARVELLLAPPRAADGEVPDPYYGGDDGFEQVYRMVYAACERLLEQIEEMS